MYVIDVLSRTFAKFEDCVEVKQHKFSFRVVQESVYGA